MRQEDIVFIGSFFSLYWGSWGALMGCERLGATAFPFGAGVSGQSDRSLEWIKEIQPTIFYCTPLTAFIWPKRPEPSEWIRPEISISAFFSFPGNPVPGCPSTKKRIEDIYGAICIDSGSTGEMSPWMTDCECELRQGMHLWQDIVYAELVDPETKKRVPYGQEGVTVYTHLERNSQPMIRYWAGDIALWTDDPCPCGRTYPRFPRGIYGRADDMFVVRGENVYPSAIEDAIRSIQGFGDEFRIIITREKTMDEMIVQAEFKPDIDPAHTSGLKQKLDAVLKARGLRSIIQIVEPGTLGRTEFKAKRVIDQRRLYDEIHQKG